MKITILSGIISVALFFAACNSNNTDNSHEGHDMNSMPADSGNIAEVPPAEVKVSAVTYTNVDANAAASIHQVVQHYLHVKNALANDDAGEAVDGAAAIAETMHKLDKSLLTAEQKPAYDAIEESLKEDVEQISKKSDDIKSQRFHFSTMSDAMYNLVRNFGAGRPIYHDHCPMFNENKGAIWLSETKEIKNPYYGSEMLTCGKLQEVMK